MGYHTQFSGVLHIDPPLTNPEIVESPYWPSHLNYNRYGLTLDVNEKSEQTGEGELLRRWAEQATIQGEELRRGHIEQQIDDFLAVHSGTHTVSGRLEWFGEDPGDLGRIQVKDGRRVNIKPAIVWPDSRKTLDAVRDALRWRLPGHVLEIDVENLDVLAGQVLVAIVEEANRS